MQIREYAFTPFIKIGSTIKPPYIYSIKIVLSMCKINYISQQNCLIWGGIIGKHAVGWLARRDNKYCQVLSNEAGDVCAETGSRQNWA